MAAEQKEGRQAGNGIKVKKALAFIVLLLALISAAGLHVFTGGQDSGSPAAEAPVMGVLDLQQAAGAHPDYAGLVELQQEIGRLEAELSVGELRAVLPETKPDESLFMEAAEQKQRLEAVERHAKLVEELNALAEQKRQELGPQLEAERSEVSRPYLNEIMNLRIKLDSADVLGLTQEQAQQMLARIDELQGERRAALDKLAGEQEARFRELMEKESAGPLAELRKLEAESRKQAQQQEIENSLAVQERNTREMQQALSPVQEKISSARKKTLLEAKKIQYQQLRDKIYNDIAGRAAKLAIMHGLTLILSSPADSLRGIDYENMQQGVWQPDLLPVLNVNTLDLTEEMLQEMKALQ